MSKRPGPAVTCGPAGAAGTTGPPVARPAKPRPAKPRPGRARSSRKPQADGNPFPPRRGRLFRPRRGRLSRPRVGPPPPAYPYELAAATLLAAGVLSALGRRRREQLWRRAIGRRVAVPVWPAPAAAAEVALRLGANEPSARMLDTGLRYLCHALGEQGRALPTVFAAHLGHQNLDLWVAPADRDAPAPWVAVGDGQVWRLPLDVVPGLDPDRSAGPVPRIRGWCRSGPMPPGGCWLTWSPPTA